MINLKEALADDIEAGLLAAEKAGDLPKSERLTAIPVKRAENPEHGDYASPVALALARQFKMPALEIVQAIVAHMPKKEYVGKLEGVPPGFLNIRINPGWMVARLNNIIREDLCADISVGKGQRYNFEFISANPAGPLTLGNARTAFSVDTLANVLNCAGYNVVREYYVNDAGGQIQKLGESILRRILQQSGTRVDYPEELYQGDYIQDAAKTIAEDWREIEAHEFSVEDLRDKELVKKIGQQAAQHFLAAIRTTIADDLKIQFDVWTSEQELRASGIIEETLTKLRRQKLTYKKQGAEYLRTTVYGDSEDRVLVKSNGEYAYIAPDIGYHHQKFEQKYDGIFTFVGADHQGHGPKLVAAMSALGHDVSKFHVVTAQWMRFVKDGKPVKLSKRRGTVYTPQELIKEVGYDATRFFMVQHALTTHMDFDLTLAKERSERNPVYYAQYAFVRLQSILRRAQENSELNEMMAQASLSSHSALTHTLEIDLLRHLYRWPEIIADIATSFEVQGLAYYALDLARAIHSFYGHVPVLAAEDTNIVQGRLQLVVAARTVLGKTLDLLGVSRPDIM